jgi:hypothetical protein
MKVYRLTISPEDDSYVFAVADVEHPAIESEFIAFDKSQQNISFAADEEKMELLGAALIPDKMIYRRDEKTNEEFYVYFTKEDIRVIAQEFFKQGFNDNVNLDHTTKKSKSYIFQSFIVDHSKGIHGPEQLSLPEGSWVIGKKILDKQEWEDIKAGKRNGFSVEGVFQMLPAKFEATQVNKEQQQADDELYNAIVGLNSILSKLK